jgi:hypothetical protein
MAASFALLSLTSSSRQFAPRDVVHDNRDQRVIYRRADSPAHQPQPCGGIDPAQCPRVDIARPERRRAEPGQCRAAGSGTG